MKKTLLTEWFEIGQKYINGRATRIYTVTCNKCGKKSEFHANSLTRDGLRKHFLRHGWAIGRAPNHHRCPTCCGVLPGQPSTISPEPRPPEPPTPEQPKILPALYLVNSEPKPESEPMPAQQLQETSSSEEETADWWKELHTSPPPKAEPKTIIPDKEAISEPEKKDSPVEKATASLIAAFIDSAKNMRSDALMSEFDKFRLEKWQYATLVDAARQLEIAIDRLDNEIATTKNQIEAATAKGYQTGTIPDADWIRRANGSAFAKGKSKQVFQTAKSRINKYLGLRRGEADQLYKERLFIKVAREKLTKEQYLDIWNEVVRRKEGDEAKPDYKELLSQLVY